MLYQCVGDVETYVHKTQFNIALFQRSNLTYLMSQYLRMNLKQDMGTPKPNQKRMRKNFWLRENLFSETRETSKPFHQLKPNPYLSKHASKTLRSWHLETTPPRNMTIKNRTFSQGNDFYHYL